MAGWGEKRRRGEKERERLAMEERARGRYQGIDSEEDTEGRYRNGRRRE